MPHDNDIDFSQSWENDYRQTLGRFEGLSRAMLLSEIRNKMHRASRGKLVSHGDSPEVEQVHGTGEALEIRLQAQHGDISSSDFVKLWTRLYFDEPAIIKDALYFLKLADKKAYPAGKVEQDEHIGCAIARLDTCRFHAVDL